jgi:hypothetical protein
MDSKAIRDRAKLGPSETRKVMEYSNNSWGCLAAQRGHRGMVPEGKGNKKLYVYL